jgi:hypothetical protein
VTTLLHALVMDQEEILETFYNKIEYKIGRASCRERVS